MRQNFVTSRAETLPAGKAAAIINAPLTAYIPEIGIGRCVITPLPADSPSLTGGA